MSARLAVDFGTSNTVAVVQRQDEPPRSLLFDGSPILPSAVCLADDGALHVGRDAQQLALVDPSRYEPYPKRRIDDGAVLLGHTEVPVVDLFAGVLRRVASEARQAGVADPAALDPAALDPTTPGSTVLTCPADWGAARRATLAAAAQRAGLGRVRLVEEPVAAATYCLAVTDVAVADGQPLAVFDFGGGTFDVALVCREGDGWRMLATGGLDDLGGVDVDAALVGHLGQLLELRDAAAWQRLDRARTPPEVRDRRTFWAQVGTAKEMLSRVTTAPVPVPRTDATLHLTRDELERVAGPLVARAVDETRRVLQRANVDASYLAGVFLVGGSSRLPLVASRLHARFGIAPTVPEQPELPVAHGALLIAATSGSPLATSATAPASSPRQQPTAANVWRPPSVPGPIVAGVATDGPPTEALPVVPPLAPPRPSSTRTRRRVLLTAAVVAVLALVTTAGIIVYNGRPDWLPDAARGGGAADEATTTGNLTEVKRLQPPAGTTAVAGVATTNAGYYAVVAGGRTQLTAEPTNGGSRWSVDLAMHPASLHLTVVGGLVIVDGERSARHGGANARAVVDAKTRRKLWESRWADRWDIGYVGTSAIVESEGGLGPMTSRVDLRTGTTGWSHTVVSSRLHSKVAVAWPTAKAPPGPVATASNQTNPAPRGFRQHLRGGTEVVEVHEDGHLTVLDSATGDERARRTGRHDVDPAVWTAYNGVVVVVADVNGQDTLVGYRLNDLREIWRRPAPAGAQVEQVKPCGEKLVCAVSKGPGGAKIGAVTTAGAHAWEVKIGEDWAAAGMAVTPAGLLYGSQADAYLHQASLMPFDGDKKREYGRKLRLAAADGAQVVLVDTRPRGRDDLVWVSVGPIDSTTQSTRLAIPSSDGIPETVSLMGGTLVVTTTRSRTIHVLKLTAASRG